MYKHFALVYFVFNGAAPIPYIQAAILNLHHPELPLYQNYPSLLYVLKGIITFKKCASKRISKRSAVFPSVYTCRNLM